MRPHVETALNAPQAEKAALVGRWRLAVAVGGARLRVGNANIMSQLREAGRYPLLLMLLVAV